MDSNAEIASAFDCLEQELFQKSDGKPARQFDFDDLVDSVTDNETDTILNSDHTEKKCNKQISLNPHNITMLTSNAGTDLTQFPNDVAMNSSILCNSAGKNNFSSLPWVNSKLYGDVYVSDSATNEVTLGRSPSSLKKSQPLVQSKDNYSRSWDQKMYESPYHLDRKGLAYSNQKNVIDDKFKSSSLGFNAVNKEQMIRPSYVKGDIESLKPAAAVSRAVSPEDLQDSHIFHKGLKQARRSGMKKMESSYSALDSLFYINLCVESKSFHFGPLQLEVSPHVTLKTLKMKLCTDLNIKSRSQKWIVGNQLIDDDDLELNTSNLVPGSFVFLYLEDRDFDSHRISEFFNATNSLTQVSERSMHINDQLRCRLAEHSGPKVAVKTDDSYQLLPPTFAKTRHNSKHGITLSSRSTERKNSDLAEKLKLLKLQQFVMKAAEKKREDFAAVDSSSSSFDSAEEVLSDTETCESDFAKTCDSADSLGKIQCLSEGQSNDEIPKSSVSIGSSTSVGIPSLECKISENERDEARRNYNELLLLDAMALIPNAYAFDCPVCFTHVLDGQGVVLRDCLHTFCKECLACAVIYASTSFVRCPFRDDIYSCDSCLQQREVRALVSPDSYEHYLQRSLVVAESIAEKSFHCKNANCPGWCLYEDNLNIFHCPVCSRYNCLTCQAIHEGINCRQYQDHLKQSAVVDEDAVRTLEFLDKMVGEGKAMKCPTCHVILMKKWGCDWLKCSVCQTEVCWITKGPRWGPGGQGDVSAGCKCGVNGKKCHPSCTYCH